jgi:hypothetical protein
MLDDNASPTDAFLWSAGIAKGPDVQFNNLWSLSRDPDSYTALWNICATPAFLAKTTDGSNHPEGRPLAAEPATTARVRHRQARPRSAPIRLPPDLKNLFERWDARGRPVQGAMLWPRERYEDMLPDHLSVLDSVPDCLDRDRLRALGARAHESQELAVIALAAIVVWGKGNGGLARFTCTQCSLAGPMPPRGSTQPPGGDGARRGCGGHGRGPRASVLRLGACSGGASVVVACATVTMLAVARGAIWSRLAAI